jgi:hypothetical protein
LNIQPHQPKHLRRKSSFRSTVALQHSLISAISSSCIICVPSAILLFFSSCWIYQLEYIIEDKVAPALWHQLEGLREIHRLLFIVDLSIHIPPCQLLLPCRHKEGIATHTINAPVTMTNIPPCGLDGCASVVSTRCCTFWKGRLCAKLVGQPCHLLLDAASGICSQ